MENGTKFKCNGNLTVYILVWTLTKEILFTVTSQLSILYFSWFTLVELMTTHWLDAYKVQYFIFISSPCILYVFLSILLVKSEEKLQFDKDLYKSSLMFTFILSEIPH